MKPIQVLDLLIRQVEAELERADREQQALSDRRSGLETERDGLCLARSRLLDARQEGPPIPAARAEVASTGTDPKVVRQWAAENGFAVSGRGRIPQGVLKAYAVQSCVATRADAAPAPAANDTAPALAEVTRAAAITRVLEEHGGCDLSELVTLLRAGGRTEEKTDSVSVVLTTMKDRGIVEGSSGEWRLVQPPPTVQPPPAGP